LANDPVRPMAVLIRVSLYPSLRSDEGAYRASVNLVGKRKNVPGG
jgi:hypothetical protein